MKGAFVYIVAVGADGGPFEAPIKVGMTSNIENRLSRIRSNSPVGVHLAYSFPFKSRKLAYAVENRFHKAMQEHQLHGEWFHVDPQEAAEIIGTFIDGGRR